MIKNTSIWAMGWSGVAKIDKPLHYLAKFECCAMRNTHLMCQAMCFSSINIYYSIGWPFLFRRLIMLTPV